MSYIFLCLLGVVIYFPVIVALKRNWSDLLKISTWYVIVANLAFADLAATVLETVISVPIVLTQKPVFGEKLGQILMNVSSFFFQAIITLSFCMTLNRFLLFLWPKVNEKLFSHVRIGKSMLATWALALFLNGAMNLVGCQMFFHPILLFPGWFCPESGLAVGVSAAYNLFNLVAPIVMLVMFLVLFIWLKIRRQNKTAPTSSEQAREQQRAKIERNILIQAFLICTSLLVGMIAFLFVPRLIETWVASFLTEMTNHVVCLMNPVIYLIFNSKIREIVFKIFKSGTSAESSIPMNNRGMEMKARLHGSTTKLGSMPQGTDKSVPRIVI